MSHARYILTALLFSAACSSSTTTTTPTTITPASFVITWGNTAFPTTGVGLTSPTTLVATLWNNGTASVPVTSIADSNSAEFPFTTTCPLAGSLAPQTTCAMTVQFKPNALGSRTATVTVNANSTTTTLSLTGTGATISPTLTIAPAGDTAPNVFTLSGSGATPGGSVEVHTTYTPAPGNPPNVFAVTTWTADASGNVTASATTTQSGIYDHWFVDLTSGLSSNHVIHTVP